ncbi:Tad domain-containing protein [Beggiatoa alba]|nr:Tad domain-containing protein [Beggiatoa alba]
MRVFARKQRGQAIVAALIIMLLSVAGLVLMYNTGQATSEKLRVVNAADAAAYSGGVWVARQLNFMAYTNRAMIANHISVGHFVSSVSWLRNTEDNLEDLEVVFTILCNIGITSAFACPLEQVIAEAEGIVETINEDVVDEFLGPAVVSGIDLFNQGLYLSQVAARFNLNQLTVNGVMESTARDYGDVNLQVSNLQVNNDDDLDGLDASSQQGAQAAQQVRGQFIPILSFVENYEATGDEGRAAGLVDDSLLLDRSKHWIRGNRGWSVPFIRKSGSTMHAVDGGNSGQTNRNECSGSNRDAGDGLNWYAKDEFRIRVRPWRVTLFSYGTCGDANATEFDSSYKGIDNYYALRNQDSDHHTLSIYAYATLDTNATAVPVYNTFRGDSPPADPYYEVRRRDEKALTANKTTALVEAQVFHGSEEEYLFSTEEGEYSNLFNPYWHTRSCFGAYDKITTVITGIHDSNSNIQLRCPAG